jgi:hypothetical protein
MWLVHVAREICTWVWHGGLHKCTITVGASLESAYDDVSEGKICSKRLWPEATRSVPKEKI